MATTIRATFSRRTVLRSTGVASAGLAAAALLGCQSSPSASAVPAEKTEHLAAAGYPTSGWKDLKFEEHREIYSPNKLKNLPGQKDGPTAGGRIRYASTTPNSFDPTGATPLTQLLAHNNLIQSRADDFVENLYGPNFQPVLAKEMPEQPDGLNYIFRLNHGVKFQNIAPVNGRELVAEDIAFVYNTYRKSPVQEATLAAVESVTATDKYTVRFKLKEPASYLLQNIAAPMYWVFAKEQADSADGLKKRPIGTGPFILDKWEPAGPFSYNKNPDYFRKDPRTGKQLPYLDGIDGLKYANTAAQIAAFRAGEIDTVNPGDLKTWAAVQESMPDSVTDIVPPLPNAINHIALRLDKPPYNDIRVRRALSLLIDRDAIIKNICFGAGGVTYGTDYTYFGKKWMWEGEDLGPWVKYNPAEAKKLLSAAGAEGMTIDALFTSLTTLRGNTYSAGTAMWEAAGLKVKIDAPTDTAVVADQKWGKNPDGTAGKYPGVFFLSDYTLGNDADIMTYTAMHSKSVTNIYHINDPKIDKMTLDQRHALTKPERLQILKDLMTYDLDQVTRIWFVEPYKIGMRSPKTYNVVDSAWAWMPPAWGMVNTEVVWKSA